MSIVMARHGRPVSHQVAVQPQRAAISGLLPEFSGLCEDPSETVIDPADVESVGTDSVWDGDGPLAG